MKDAKEYGNITKKNIKSWKHDYEQQTIFWGKYNMNTVYALRRQHVYVLWKF